MSGMDTHYITQQAKGLEGCLGVWMNLGGSHIERPKDANCEFIKWEGDMKVPEKNKYTYRRRGDRYLIAPNKRSWWARKAKL